LGVHQDKALGSKIGLFADFCMVGRFLLPCGKIMTMQRIILIALFFGLTLAACKNEAAPETSEQAPSTETMTPDPSAFTPAPEATTVSNPNPPHGQPGHRCDIPVGASLDSAPPKEQGASSPVFQNKPATTTTSPVTTQPSGTTQQVAPGTNPPHGQPGHRCDIPVGAPLDSAPKQ